MPHPPKNLKTLDALQQIVAHLRGPNGCPWDKEQTPRTLTRYVLEEAYELVEAIEDGSDTEIIGELGDYLFQVALQVQIFSEMGRFGWEEVLEAINAKMVRRHPHVFGSESADSSQDVWKRWNTLKAEEKARENTPAKSERRGHALDVPSQLPQLMKAQKIGEKARGVEFDWNTAREVLDKVREELAELEAAIAGASQSQDQAEADATHHAAIEDELGDLLFSVTQLARHLQIEAEAALRGANGKFLRRFAAMLASATPPLTVEEFKALSPEQKQKLWDAAKRSVAASETQTR